jgi:hypothetical protein
VSPSSELEVAEAVALELAVPGWAVPESGSARVVLESASELAAVRAWAVPARVVLESGEGSASELAAAWAREREPGLAVPGFAART